MEMLKKPQKALKLIAYLEEMIFCGEFPAGSKLPSTRQFAAQFNISFGAALSAIDFLCAEGLVEKKQRSGVFVKGHKDVCESESGNSIKIVFVSGKNKSIGLFASAYRGMDEMARARKIELKQFQLSSVYGCEALFEEISRTASGLVLLYECDNLVDFLPLNIPCVGVLVHNWQGKISTIDIDPFMIAENACQYFMNIGIGKVMVVSYPHQTYRQRARLFADSWRRYGGKVGLIEYGDEIDYSSEYGYFFCSDNTLYDYSVIYKEMSGKELASDYVVLGVDGKSLIVPDFHKFPTLSADWKEIGKYALEECMYRISNPGSSPKRIYVPCRLIVPENHKREEAVNEQD